MSHFRLLSDPGAYIAHDWDLLKDEKSRAYWLDLFASHFQELLRHASVQYGRSAGRQIAEASRQFNSALEALKTNPSGLPSGRLDVMELCRLREGILRKQRMPDPFGNIKKRENATAVAMYPAVVRKLHSMSNSDKWLHLVRCVFAGNIFDLGATSTMHLADAPADFLGLIERTKPRPWLVDDYDALAADLLPVPPSKWAKAVVFVDNAGSDFVLGIMPLVRELALCGTKIVLAANELPSLNDITADETAVLVERLAADDEDLSALVRAGMFEVVSTGNDLPLIDLSNVSDELNEAAEGADLVVLEGMGRAVESNADAGFNADFMRLAILKDEAVAARAGGGLYDCICGYRTFQPAAS